VTMPSRTHGKGVRDDVGMGNQGSRKGTGPKNINMFENSNTVREGGGKQAAKARWPRIYQRKGCGPRGGRLPGEKRVLSVKPETASG